MICGYISCSADGFVADETGSVRFLKPFEGLDFGFHDFLNSIDAVVMGRATYDQILSFGVPWPYAGKTSHIVTSRPLGDAPDGVSRWDGTLADYAHAMADRRAWVVGGARLQAAMIAAGLVDYVDLFVIPVLLGRGVPLFPGEGPVPMTLSESQSYDRGVMRLRYRFPDPEAA